ncbi:MAG: hypothetical protein F6K56_38640 [Moorea sp. SIO3G5]|nr:hypothetical protein [Moorena sp. SIO3G5]
MKTRPPAETGDSLPWPRRELGITQSEAGTRPQSDLNQMWDTGGIGEVTWITEAKVLKKRLTKEPQSD